MILDDTVLLICFSYITIRWHASRRWGEVDFLLRKRIESEEDIGYTTAAAEAGMLFIDQVR